MYGGFFVKKYTKLCLATLCFISSVPVLADGYKGEAPPLVPVSIPTFNGGFEFTIGALYMTPDSSNLDYLGSQNSETAFPGVNDIDNHIDFGVNPNYNWGFLLGLGYVFPGTANDVKLDWMYFHNDFKSSEYVVGAGTNVVFVPSGDSFLDGSSVLYATGKVDYDFDAVDLTFGQYINIGSRLQTRLFTGLRYMRLDSDLSTSYSVSGSAEELLPIDLINNYNGAINSSFNGLGPMVGIKADYYLGAGFSLSGAIDGALLVGQLSLDANTQHEQQRLISGVWSVVNIDDANFDWDNQNVIAPGFDAKFGLNYKYQFNNGTLLGLELGYQVTKYIDVVAQGGDETPAPIIASSAVQTSGGFETADVTNFRLAGPYLTLNVKI